MRLAPSILLALACLAFGIGPAAVGYQDAAPAAPDTPPLDLPLGPAAVGWRGVSAETLPAALPGAAWPRWTDRGPAGWGSPDPWCRWVETVRAEAAGTSDPRRRAALARFARARGRDFEAWDHFAACAASPEVLAALAPSFFPGVPGDHAVEAGGTPAPLADGVLLAPALPPRPFVENGVPVGLTEHAMEHRGFRVGEAMVAMRLKLERDGVQVDLHHLSGPPVTVRILLPTPPKEEIGVAYVDWFRQDEPGPLTVPLSAEEPTHELWGRFRSRSAPWPNRLPSALPAQIGLGGIAVRVAPAALDSPFLREFAGALGALLGAPCRLVAADAPPTAVGLEPLAIHLEEGPEYERKLAGLLSLTESFALQH